MSSTDMARELGLPREGIAARCEFTRTSSSMVGALSAAVRRIRAVTSSRDLGR